MAYWTNLLNDMLVVGALIFLLISLLTGLAFIIAPGRAVGLERQADRRFSLRKALKPLEIPRQTERFFYRHHRIVGAMIVIFASIFLWIYLVEGEGGRIAAWAGKQLGAEVVSAWAANLGWFMVLLNFAAVLFGAVMFVRPSALKNVEAVANRWISTRQATRGLDTEHDPLGRFAARNPRLFGSLVLLGSLFILVNLLYLIR